MVQVHLGAFIKMTKKEEVDYMAFMKQAKTEDEIKKMTVKQVKDAYNTLATDYNHLIEFDYYYCHCCNTFQSKSNFYKSKTNASGYFHMCKKCTLKAATE